MSVSVAGSGQAANRTGAGAPRGLRLFFVASSGVALLLMLSQLAQDTETLVRDAPYLFAWLVVVALADFVAVPLWGTITLSMSLPVSLAAAMLFSPAEAALVAFLGALDPREFKGEVSVDHAVYNRSQIAISVLLASSAFHALHGDPSVWPEVLGPFAVALGVDFVATALLVMVPAGILQRMSPWHVLVQAHGDEPFKHVTGYVCVGSLAVLLAAIYDVAGVYGLLVCCIPLVIAQQMFSHVRRLSEATRKIEAKDRTLLTTVERVVEERRDERLVVAGELHDEVLPPLFKVHLMGQVLRQDLNSGRLLDLDDDLPELLAATEAAQSAIRDLVGDLRRSPLGAGGLVPTLRLLCDQLAGESEARISMSVEHDGGSDVVQLLLYQVAKEALNNAVRHSGAAQIHLRIWKRDGLIRLLVEDDGRGFNVHRVDRNEHFGLQLIAERVESARGTVVVDSTPGEGTRVLASLPPRLDA
jgi:signal transduction histidine kinase